MLPRARTAIVRLLYAASAELFPNKALELSRVTEWRKGGTATADLGQELKQQQALRNSRLLKQRSSAHSNAGAQTWRPRQALP